MHGRFRSHVKGAGTQIYSLFYILLDLFHLFSLDTDFVTSSLNFSISSLVPVKFWIVIKTLQGHPQTFFMLPFLLSLPDLPPPSTCPISSRRSRAFRSSAPLHSEAHSHHHLFLFLSNQYIYIFRFIWKQQI